MTVIQKRVVVPKQHFFVVINHREQFFQCAIFHEIIPGQSFFNGYTIS